MKTTKESGLARIDTQTSKTLNGFYFSHLVLYAFIRKTKRPTYMNGNIEMN